MAQRPFTATLKHPSTSQPWAGGVVTLRYSGRFTSGVDVVYPAETATFVADAAGQITDAVTTPDSGAGSVPVQVTLPDGSSFFANLSYGTTPVTLADLVASAAALTAGAWNSIATIVNAHAAVVASATVLGHVKVGANLTIDPDGTLHAPAGGTAGTYTHTQAIPAVEWIVNHNLGFDPSVELRTTGGAEFEAEVVHQTSNQARISLTTALAGTARCT